MLDGGNRLRSDTKEARLYAVLLSRAEIELIETLARREDNPAATPLAHKMRTALAGMPERK